MTRTRRAVARCLAPPAVVGGAHTRTSRRAMARLLLTLAVVGGVLGGCGLTRTASGPTTSIEPPPARVGTVENTRVQVIQNLGGQKFNASAIYKLYGPGVVTIVATFGSSNNAALGSGFVIDGQGDIATNAHVILGDPPKLARASNVFVEFADGNRVPARVVGADLNADIALLKVDPAGLSLTPLRLGSSGNLVVGEPVAAIGSPFGENQSLSVGVISATGRDIESLTAFRIGNAIQTDAAINHGNSGGPLLAANGDVIGVNSQIQSSSGGGEGVGFAIPVDAARRSLDQLRRFGRVSYAFLGVTSEDLYPQLAQRLGMAASQGALIADVQSGSPAQKAGLSAGTSKIDFESDKGLPAGGDAIVAVDGQPVRKSSDLTNLIGLKNPGEHVSLTVVRGGSRRTVDVTLASRPAASGGGG